MLAPFSWLCLLAYISLVQARIGKYIPKWVKLKGGGRGFSQPRTHLVFINAGLSTAWLFIHKLFNWLTANAHTPTHQAHPQFSNSHLHKSACLTLNEFSQALEGECSSLSPKKKGTPKCTHRNLTQFDTLTFEDNTSCGTQTQTPTETQFQVPQAVYISQLLGAKQHQLPFDPARPNLIRSIVKQHPIKNLASCARFCPSSRCSL